jgi:hypothetical protein
VKLPVHLPAATGRAELPGYEIFFILLPLTPTFNSELTGHLAGLPIYIPTLFSKWRRMPRNGQKSLGAD